MILETHTASDNTLTKDFFDNHLTTPILQTDNLSIGYSNTILEKDLKISLKNGEMACLIGPNGCGKSTLMRTIAGLQKPLSGDTYIYDKNLKDLPLHKYARFISLVLTDKIFAGNLQVRDIVSIGRYPYINFLGKLQKSDIEIIHQSMQKTHVEEYADQYFNELSDGEKQRVMIAKALAQDTPLIMLDEPTAHLDLPNRVEIMNILKQLAKDTHKAILLSTHELDLALQTADTIWLMNRKSKLISGSPEDLVLSGAFEKVFAANSFDFDKHTGAFTVRHEIKDVVTLNGHGIQYLWTKKALQREGYQINNMVPGHISIDIIQKGSWKAQIGNHARNCNNVSELLSFLRHSAYYLKSSSNGSIETKELCPLQKNYMQ